MRRPAPPSPPTGTRSTQARRRPWRRIPTRSAPEISATPTPTPRPLATDLRLDRDAEEAADVGDLVVDAGTHRWCERLERLDGESTAKTGPAQAPGPNRPAADDDSGMKPSPTGLRRRLTLEPLEALTPAGQHR